MRHSRRFWRRSVLIPVGPAGIPQNGGRAPGAVGWLPLPKIPQTGRRCLPSPLSWFDRVAMLGVDLMAWPDHSSSRGSGRASPAPSTSGRRRFSPPCPAFPLVRQRSVYDPIGSAGISRGRGRATGVVGQQRSRNRPAGGAAHGTGRITRQSAGLDGAVWGALLRPPPRRLVAYCDSRFETDSAGASLAQARGCRREPLTSS
jgi:hypothetical protein